MFLVLILAVTDARPTNAFAKNLAVLCYNQQRNDTDVFLFSLDHQRFYQTSLPQQRGGDLISSPNGIAQSDLDYKSHTMTMNGIGDKTWSAHFKLENSRQDSPAAEPYGLLGWDGSSPLYRINGRIERMWRPFPSFYSSNQNCVYWVREPKFELKFFDDNNCRVELRGGKLSHDLPGPEINRIIVNRFGEAAISMRGKKTPGSIWFLSAGGGAGMINKDAGTVFVDDQERFYYSVQKYPKYGNPEVFRTDIYTFSKRLIARLKGDIDPIFFDSKSQTLFAQTSYGGDFLIFQTSTHKQKRIASDVPGFAPLNVWWWQSGLCTSNTYQSPPP